LRRVSVLHLKSCALKIYDVSNRRFLLLNSALKFATLYWQIDCAFQADCHRENCCTADFYSQRTEFESGMPKAWTARRARIRPESGGWQSAVHLRADCQAVNLIVANHGIGERSLAKQWNPAPAIFRRETACLTHHRFLTLDFSSVKLICGTMFRLKQYTHVVSVDTLSHDTIPLMLQRAESTIICKYIYEIENKIKNIWGR
jgi:hypothetical protein